MEDRSLEEEDQSPPLLVLLEYLEEALNKPLLVPLGFLVERHRLQVLPAYLEEDLSLRPASNQQDLPQCLELHQHPLNLRPVELLVVPSASRQQNPQEVSSRGRGEGRGDILRTLEEFNYLNY